MLLPAAMLLTAGNASAQSLFKPWTGQMAPAAGRQLVVPDQYRVFTANDARLKELLSTAAADPGKGLELDLPQPDGSSRRFRIWKTPMMEASLLQRYESDIQTFTGTALDDGYVSAKIDITVHGFHAMIFDGAHTSFIDPYSDVADGYYTVYYKKDYRRSAGRIMTCELEDRTLPEGGHAERLDGSLPPIKLKQYGSTRKTYRLALSCTGEYAAAVGGSTPTTLSVLSAMTTTMNRVNGIYERELGVTMVLIGNNDQLVYLSAATDPFTGNNNGGLLLNQNQSNTNAVIGAAGYDIGHIFSTGGGGVAFLGGVCRDNIKARGVTGSANPVGDPYDVDYVSHEMGHQFGADHSFNACTNEAASQAFEPGSGSTIMGYAGICSGNNLQEHSDAYFHPVSLDYITDYITNSFGAGCAVTAAGTEPPLLPSVSSAYTIPYLTPFELTAAAATTTSSDTLRYSWEQWDLGSLQQPESGSANFTAGPSFRSFPPAAALTRVFPRIDSVIRNVAAYKGERLPAVARSLHFKAIAKNIYNGFGGFDLSEESVTLTVINTGDTFKVTAPNLATDSAFAGQSHTITWKVAQTEVAPVSAATVDIFLSLDGGYTYPLTLASAVPNTGLATVAMPDTFSLRARVKVKGGNNVFFDISDADFVLYRDGMTSVADVTLDRSVEFYPNPATSMVYIRNHGKNKLQLRLCSALGQTLRSAVLTQSMEMQVSDLARGIYYLEIADLPRGARTVKRLSIR